MKFNKLFCVVLAAGLIFIAFDNVVAQQEGDVIEGKMDAFIEYDLAQVVSLAQ